METGKLLHAPSAPELAGWKARKALIGLALLIAAGVGAYVGIKGLDGGGSAGDGTVLVTVVTMGASVAIGYFGLRYLLIGIKGNGVRFFERAVEADLHRGLGILPRRRTIPLLHIRVSGSSRLTYAQAITTTGHAFRLPAALVEGSDLWYLGSLGTRPLAPGGRKAKDRFEEGEIEPYKHPSSVPLPDHGPAWTDPGTLPITVDVPVEPGTEAPSTSVVSPPGPPTEPPPREPIARAPPAIPAPPISPPPEREMEVVMDLPEAVPPPETSRPEPEMEVLMDLPEEVPPPETQRVNLPPPPKVRPPSIDLREPPAHRPMERDEVQMPPEAGPPEPPSKAPPKPEPPPQTSDEWELEELPPPDTEKKGRPPSSGGEWEEM